MRTDLDPILVNAQDNNIGEVSIIAEISIWEDGSITKTKDCQIKSYKLTNTYLEITVYEPPTADDNYIIIKRGRIIGDTAYYANTPPFFVERAINSSDKQEKTYFCVSGSP